MKTALVLILALLAPAAAIAHPGHATPEAHDLAGPVFLLLLWLAMAAACVVTRARTVQS